MNVERKGKFIFSEENFAEGTVTERELHPEDRVVLANGRECKIEVEVKENGAIVSIIERGSHFVHHRWSPREGEFTRSSVAPLNHGASFNPKEQSLSVEFRQEDKKIRRTVYWRGTDA